MSDSDSDSLDDICERAVKNYVEGIGGDSGDVKEFKKKFCSRWKKNFVEGITNSD